MKEKRNLRKEKKMLVIRLIGGFGFMALGLIATIFNAPIYYSLGFLGVGITIIYVNLRNAGVL